MYMLNFPPSSLLELAGTAGVELNTDGVTAARGRSLPRARAVTGRMV